MEYRNPKINEAGQVDCEINHPIYGWIPHTADKGSPLEATILNAGGLTKALKSREQLKHEVELEYKRRISAFEVVTSNDTYMITPVFMQNIANLNAIIGSGAGSVDGAETRNISGSRVPLSQNEIKAIASAVSAKYIAFNTALLNHQDAIDTHDLTSTYDINQFWP